MQMLKPFDLEIEVMVHYLGEVEYLRNGKNECSFWI